MTSIPLPKQKPSNRWHKAGSPFPVPLGTEPHYNYWNFLCLFEDGRVYVEDEISMKQIYSKGYFGKGSFSRGEPLFDRTGEIYRSSTYEFKDVGDLRPFESSEMLKIPSGISEQVNQSVIVCEDQCPSEAGKLSCLKPFPINVSADLIEIPSTSGLDTSLCEPMPTEKDPVLATKSGAVESLLKEDVELMLEEEEKDDTILATQSDVDELWLKEDLELMLEEAFFLKYCLNCLDVVDRASGKYYSCSELWDLFSQVDERFPKRYVAYHYYRSKGWVVKSGLIFGGDFALYKDGPPHYHSTFVVMVKDSEEENISWTQLSALVRVTEKMGKTVIICEICRGDVTGYFLNNFSDYQVRELMIKRWVPSKQRLEECESE